jgi:cell division protein FtsN
MRRRQGGSRTGTFLVLAGIAGVLTVTFIAGVWTGHNWPVLTGDPKSPAAAEPAPAASSGRRAAGERPRPAETLPALTFYHELTAPLTAPPPRPARPARPRDVRREEPNKTDGSGPASPAAAASGAELPAVGEGSPRFTIQVAAYSARPLAEALRATLSAAGHEARIVETESGSSTRYRVQVGTFVTREAAREAALRLAAERSAPAFVTTR